MKKTIATLLVSITAVSVFCQQAKPLPALTKQDYILKSKHQKTAAFLLLGTGIIESGAGLTMAVAKATADATKVTVGVIAGVPPSDVPKHSYKAESTLLIMGSVSVLSSIPFFTASAKNKRKSLSVSFKNEMAPQMRNTSIAEIPVPSLSVHISL